jgi:hypothetical protein
MDVGAIGRDVSGAHGHADLLSLQCSAFGEDFVVDPGTFSYTPSPAWRDYFRTTAAHSTIVVDGRSQAEPAGAFSWRTRPCVTLRSWYSTAECDFADAHHDAYASREDRVRHRRRVLFVKPSYWIVVDDLYGERRHTVELRFQFAPRPIDVAPDGWVLAHGAGGRGLRLRAFGTGALEPEIRRGREHPPDGWTSPSYGTRQPAPALVYALSAQLPARLVTLILPCERAASPAPEIDVMRNGDGVICRLAFVGSDEVVHIGEHSVVSDRRDRQQEDGWRNIS